MPGYLLHAQTVIANCFHGSGQVSIIATNQNVRILGQAVATFLDQSPVAGCPFTVGTKAQPCVKVGWEAAQRIRVNGQRVILQTSSALCYNAENGPQGMPSSYVGQSRVSGE